MNRGTSRYAVILVLLVIISLPALTVGIRFVGREMSALVISYPTPTPTLSPIPPPVEYRENSPNYKFTNPLLFSESSQRFYSEYDPLDNSLNASISTLTKSHVVDEISVYARDLNSGHWTGINDSEKFEPSSMLKVAVMISYYRAAVNQSDLTSASVNTFLGQQLFYPGYDGSGLNYPPGVHLPVGYYSYADLINDMIVNSDNVAMKVLLANNQDEFNKVYADFRLPASTDGGSSDFMTAKSYSVVFRTLFNSTYLPWDLSEKVLQELASTTFAKGIVAGVPGGMVVSHKFGEHTNLDGSGNLVNHELHDCGIVYYPGKPYFICVMTKGQDFSKLETAIATMSKLVYAFVDATAQTSH